MLFSSRLLDRLPVQTFTSSLPQRLCGKKRSRAENMLFRVQSLFVMELQTKTDLHLLPVFLLKGQSQSLPTIDRKWITSKTWRRGRAVPAQQWEGGRRWGVGRKREGWRNWSLSGAKLLVETGVSHPAELDKWNTARHVPVQPYKISMERFFFFFFATLGSDLKWLVFEVKLFLLFLGLQMQSKASSHLSNFLFSGCTKLLWEGKRYRQAMSESQVDWRRVLSPGVVSNKTNNVVHLLDCKVEKREGDLHVVWSA